MFDELTNLDRLDWQCGFRAGISTDRWEWEAIWSMKCMGPMGFVDGDLRSDCWPLLLLSFWKCTIRCTFGPTKFSRQDHELHNFNFWKVIIASPSRNKAARRLGEEVLLHSWEIGAFCLHLNKLFKNFKKR